MQICDSRKDMSFTRQQPHITATVNLHTSDDTLHPELKSPRICSDEGSGGIEGRRAVGLASKPRVFVLLPFFCMK